MREILFRGKRIDNGEWVYGGYHKHIARQICPIGDKLEECDIIHLMIQSGFADWNMSRPLQATEVIPKTVGQFTGLTDKNGTKIFEGDIIKNDSTHDLEIVIENGHTIVKFIDFGCRHKEMIYSDYIKREELEVIGNIHEKGETK